MKGTLKSRRAFQYIYDHGRRAIGPHVVVFGLTDVQPDGQPDGQPESQSDGLYGETAGAVGIVASRKVGHSPDRSRAKRVLRAALREVRARHSLRGHVILVARRALIEDGVRSPGLAAELVGLLERTGSLEDDPA